MGGYEIENFPFLGCHYSIKKQFLVNIFYTTVLSTKNFFLSVLIICPKCFFIQSTNINYVPTKGKGLKSRHSLTSHPGHHLFLANLRFPLWKTSFKTV